MQWTLASRASLADGGGGGGGASLKHIGAVGRAAGAVAARETHAQVAGRQRREGLKYVLWGPRGVGKSTLALKFEAGKAEWVQPLRGRTLGK